MMDDLENATIDQIFSELQKRSRSLVIGFEPPSMAETLKLMRHGSKVGIAGLIQSLSVESDRDLLGEEYTGMLQ